MSLCCNSRPKTKKGLKKEFKTGGIKLPMFLCCKCGWKLWNKTLWKSQNGAISRILNGLYVPEPFRILEMAPVLHCQMQNFFIEPPPDTQRKERQGERGMWVAVSCHAPCHPSSPPSPPHRASGAPPAATLSVLAEGRLLPPLPSLPPHPRTPIAELGQFSASSAKSEDGLHLGA